MKETNKGYWWLPGDEDSKCNGELDTSSRYPVLSLNGVGSDNIARRIPPFVIHGLLLNGLKVTMFECHPNGGSQFLHTGMGELNIESSCVIVGDNHYVGGENIYGGVKLSLSLLSEWTHLTAIKIDHQEGKQIIHLEPIEAIKFDLKNGVKGELGFTIDEKFGTYGKESFSVSEGTYLEFSFESKKNITELEEFGRKIQTFLMFCTRKPIKIEKMTPIIEYKKRKIGNSERLVPMADTVYAYFIENDEKKIEYRNQLIWFEDIKDKFGESLGRWLDLNESIRPALDLLFSVKRATHMYLENEFLVLCQALESLHRRTMGRKAFNEAQFGSMLVDMIATIPDEHKEWWIGKLKNLNSPTLRDRLQEMVGSFQEVWAGYKSVDVFAQRVSATRNYYTHFGEKTKHVYSLEEMMLVVGKLEALIEMHVLKELGFSAKDVLDISNKNYMWKEVIDR
jgi:hypothetical protein